MDDAELKHALEFPLSRLETVRSEASGSGRDRRTSRFDMMVDIVLHWSVGLSDLSEGWKLGQEYLACSSLTSFRTMFEKINTTSSHPLA